MSGTKDKNLPSEPRSKLWRFKEHWSGESAKWAMGSFSAYVMDMDGDQTIWEVTRGETVLGSGAFRTGNDWARALEAAENCLIAHGALYGGVIAQV